jgi:hypothetical protein
MGTGDDGHSIPLLDELHEVIEMGAGWISHDESRGEVNGLGTIVDHLFRNVLDVPTWTSTTGRIPYHLQGLVLGVD